MKFHRSKPFLVFLMVFLAPVTIISTIDVFINDDISELLVVASALYWYCAICRCWKNGKWSW